MKSESHKTTFYKEDLDLIGYGRNYRNFSLYSAKLPSWAILNASLKKSSTSGQLRESGFIIPQAKNTPKTNDFKKSLSKH